MPPPPNESVRRLPEDIALALMRALGVYIRAMPPQELPSHIRRFKGFRDSALARNRDTIVAMLDDETERALILQWIEEDRPPLKKDDLELLKLAAERPDGWEEELASRSKEGAAPAEPSDDTGKLKHAVEREKEKARKARDEARRAKTDLDAQLRAEKARAEDAMQQNRSLETEVEKLRKELAEVVTGANKAQERFDRELRRARADVDKAGTKTSELADQVKALRKELASKEKEIAALKGSAAATARKAKSKKGAAEDPDGFGAGGAADGRAGVGGPRVPLPVPKGRFEDDPETLDAWLTSGPLLVLDGYNVTKAEGGYGDLELQKQRERLVDEANKLARRRNLKGYIVFDGSEVDPHPKRTLRSTLKVQYSAPGVIADDHIEELIQSLPPSPVVLVTNDRELQDRGRKLGATIATSNQFLALLR